MHHIPVHISTYWNKTATLLSLVFLFLRQTKSIASWQVWRGRCAGAGDRHLQGRKWVYVVTLLQRRHLHQPRARLPVPMPRAIHRWVSPRVPQPWLPHTPQAQTGTTAKHTITSRLTLNANIIHILRLQNSVNTEQMSSRRLVDNYLRTWQQRPCSDKT